MSISTSQQIADYYERYRDTEVTFTKDVIKAVSLDTKHVFIKCLGYQWPCIIYSSSLVGAKTIVNKTQAFTEQVRKAGNLVSLRFSFIQSDKQDPLTFFVTARITAYSPYNSDTQATNLTFLTLQFTQRPPDTLIEILGTLLEASSNSKKRSEERITMTPEVFEHMGINPKATYLAVQGVPRRCVVRDLSFSGGKVILVGFAKLLVEKPCSLRLEFARNKDIVEVPGRVIRHEPVEGRSDIAAFAIQFDSERIPAEYKLRINNYLKDKYRLRHKQDNRRRTPGTIGNGRPRQ